MKTIIVSTDFSPASANAVNYAAGLAAEIGAAIVLLNTYQVPVTVTEVPVVTISVDDLKKNSEAQLREAKEMIVGNTGSRVKVYTESKLGDTTDELEELCKKLKPFAVVVGTKGTSDFEQVLFGSTTSRIIRHLTCPVITVPSESRYNGGIRKIGFACNFKKVVETTPTALIKEFVKEFNAQLHVLNVDVKNRNQTTNFSEESLLLHTLLEDLKPVYHFIEEENIEDGINRFADENDLDLLITIPKKHNLFESLFKKSSAKRLVFHSHVPVMCVHE